MPANSKHEREERPFRQNSYLRAAAVLCYFDPDRIRPAGGMAGGSAEEAFQGLLSASTITYDGNKQPQWTLRSDIRRKVLAEIKSPTTLRRLLEANPDRAQNTLQRILEAYLRDKGPTLKEQSLEELSSTLQVIEWLSGILPTLPNVDDVQLQIERETMLKSFRDLADEHFHGRKSELAQLRNYVGVLPSDSVYESLSRRVRSILSLTEKPPLLVYGPGGMGKSTLIGRFILEHVETNAGDQLPFVYLDFDRPTLLASEPLTLLADALSQLAVQFPSQRKAFRARRDEILEAISKTARFESLGSPATVAEEARPLRVNERARRSLLISFSNSLILVHSPELPVLFVLDTFEQVQLRSREYVSSLWEFLNALQERIPQLRVVLSGRAPVTEFKTEMHELKPLDTKSARAVLESHGFPRDVAKLVVAQVGSSPLSLWLAARALQKEGVSPDGISNLDRKRYLTRLKEDVVQGILYRRILGHIVDESARRLAHPGLVLRRITPEIIARVLAGPCGVVVRDSQHAEELFRTLRSDMTLVKQAEDGSLRHQPYMRAVMVRLLREDEPEKAKTIERLAVEFYHSHSDPVSRAEEIFHRLLLGESPEKVNARWIPGVERYLASEIEELPKEAQAFLLARARHELSEPLMKKASAADLERATVSRATDLIELEKFEEALKFLEKEQERHPSLALRRLEARALIGLQRLEQARHVLRTALSQDLPSGPEDMLEIHLACARLDGQLGWIDPPEMALDEFGSLVRRFPRDIRVVEYGVLRMELLQPATLPSPAAESSKAFAQLDLGRRRFDSAPAMWLDLRLKVGRLLSEYIARRPVQAELVNQPELCRRAIAALGADFPELAGKLVRQVGIGDELIQWMQRSLPAFLAEWGWRISPPAKGADPLLVAAGISRPPRSVEEVWIKVLQQGERAKLVDFLLRDFELPVELVPQLAAIIKQAIRDSKERGIHLA